jgi:hypothetical protein
MAATKLTSFSHNLCSFQKEVAQPHARIDNIHAANFSIFASQRVLKVPGAVRKAPLRAHSSFSKGSSLHLCSAKSIAFSVSPACTTLVCLHFVCKMDVLSCQRCFVALSLPYYLFMIL